jgi:hypothetical protein
MVIMTKIIGFDVGFKNLAYCIIEHNDSSGKWEICQPLEKYWGIINLMDESEDCVIEGCEQAAKHMGIINGKVFYVCGRHKKQYDKICTNTPILGIDVCNGKCQNTKSCGKKAIKDVSGTLMCQKHYEMFVTKENKARQLKVHKSTMSDYRPEERQDRMISALEKHYELFTSCTYVTIENQPMANTTMKMLDGLIHIWFRIRGVHNAGTVKATYASQATNKLTLLNNDALGYSERKATGIEHCKHFLRDNNTALQYIDTFKKKDDICDAYLHALYYAIKKIKS